MHPQLTQKGNDTEVANNRAAQDFFCSLGMNDAVKLGTTKTGNDDMIGHQGSKEGMSIGTFTKK